MRPGGALRPYSIWTGGEMIVWGGISGAGAVKTAVDTNPDTTLGSYQRYQRAGRAIRSHRRSGLTAK